MIVKCEQCQSRFKIPDHKVTEKGVKVRCTKCQHTFRVTREPQAGVTVPVPHHRHWLATVGSVGQPRDGNPQAMYAVFDTDKLQLTFQRVSYDHQTAAAAIRQAGLPALFADRLELGR